jgi:hypothetical protein
MESLICRLVAAKMKLSIAIEMDEGVPQCGAASSLVTKGDNPRQRELSCHVSSNFVAQLAATFLQTPQTRARRRLEVRDAIRTYDDAVALGRLFVLVSTAALTNNLPDDDGECYPEGGGE